MPDVGAYTALVYNTVTGNIIGPAELPINALPTWNRQVNNAGAWGVVIPFGATWSAREIRAIAAGKRFSVAIFWGDYCCQAGPITGYAPNDKSNSFGISGGGLWTMFNNRLLHNRTYNPAALPIVDPSADVTYNDSLSNIARSLISDTTSYTHRPAPSLPIDLPAAFTSDNNTRTYYGYDLAMVGQRLQELTQVDGGPDIDFKPYRVGNQIRHQVVIGNPHIQQTGAPVMFDYQTSLESLPITGDGSKVATDAWVKGAGNERLQLSGHASSTLLTDSGWPLLDYVDTAHTSATEQPTLDGWAAADLVLYGRSVEQWAAVVRADGTSPLGSYDPGYFATYNVNDHPYVPDGQYNVRILGLGNGPEANNVTHFLDGRGGF